MTIFSEIGLKLKELDEADPSFQLRKAVASFLFMVMPVDGQTHPKELERLRRILADDFDLTEEGITQLISHSNIDSRDNEVVQNCADIIKAGFDKDQIITLVSHMWEMVFADGRLHESEVLLVERVASLLHVPPEEVAKAMTS